MFGAMTSLTGGGSLQGGSSGPATAENTNNSGQSVGGINLGGGGVSPYLLIGLAIIAAIVVIKK